MNVVPAQVAGVTRVALASPPQREHGGRCTRRSSRAARLLGVDEVYAMGGAGAIGAFAYGVAEPRTRPGRRRHRPRQQLRRGGQARRRGRRRDGCRGRRHRDPRGRRRHRRPAARRRRPDQPGRARRAGLGRAGHRLRVARRRRRGRDRAARGRARATPSGSRRRWRGPQSAIVLVDDLERRRRSATPTRPSTSSCTSPIRTPDDVRPRRRDLRRSRLAGEPRRLPRRQQPRAADRRSGALRAGLSAATFLRPQQVIEYDRAALARGARRRSSRSPRPSSSPPTARRSTARFEAPPVS